MILVLSPGRSGTHFLFSLCSTLPGVSAYHEPQPTLSCYEFAQGELSMKESAEIINQKTKKILESIRNSRCSTYIETSHTLLHHTLVPSPLIEGLLRNIDNRLIGIILLKRNLAEVMFSRARLWHMTRYVNAGKYYYRGVGWMYTPNSKNASLCPIKPDKQLTQLELLAGYVLNVEIQGFTKFMNFMTHFHFRFNGTFIRDLNYHNMENEIFWKYRRRKIVCINERRWC